MVALLHGRLIVDFGDLILFPMYSVLEVVQGLIAELDV